MTQLTTITGAMPPAYAFGTMQFGGRADEAASRALYDACRAAGITHFDTAHGYNGGRSEELLGEFAASERDQLFVATKCSNGGDASPATIKSECDLSLKRLQMDYVDLFYMHRFDDNTPLEETVATLVDLKSQGKIRFLGVSNYSAWQVVKADAIARAMGARIDVVQPMYNLVKRQAEVEILPMCASEDVLAVPYSPLGGGLLTGKYASGGAGRLSEDSMYAARYAPAEMHATAKALSELAASMDTSPATLAASWVAHHSAGPVPILSARNPEQLAPSLAAMTFKMDEALYHQISALSMTPPPATDRLEEAGG